MCAVCWVRRASPRARSPPHSQRRPGAVLGDTAVGCGGAGTRTEPPAPVQQTEGPWDRRPAGSGMELCAGSPGSLTPRHRRGGHGPQGGEAEFRNLPPLGCPAPPGEWPPVPPGVGTPVLWWFSLTPVCLCLPFGLLATYYIVVPEQTAHLVTPKTTSCCGAGTVGGRPLLVIPKAAPKGIPKVIPKAIPKAAPQPRGDSQPVSEMCGGPGACRRCSPDLAPPWLRPSSSDTNCTFPLLGGMGGGGGWLAGRLSLVPLGFY